MLIAEIIEKLKVPIPRELMSSKKIKGNTIDFVAWYDICELLDERCGLGNWEWDIANLIIAEGQCSITGRLTVYGDDRRITMMATGIEAMDCSSYGDPSSNAEAMALRRAASKLGLGRDMWRKGKPPSYAKKAAHQVAKKFGGVVVGEENEKPEWYDRGIAYFVEKGLPKGVVEKLAKKYSKKDEFFNAASQVCKDTIGG